MGSDYRQAALMDDAAAFRRLVISPHLDDAALSCGGSIHHWTSKGEPVLVVTIVTADPPAAELSAFARYQHDSWHLSASEAYRVRRDEDRCAMSRMGVKSVHLGFPDCIYRGNRGGFFYNSDDDLFGTVHPDDRLLVDLLVEHLSRLEYLAAGLVVYAPLGLGNHVDHQLARKAVERWRGDDIVYYEDFPYADNLQEQASPPDCFPVTNLLDHMDIEARIDAIACYESQIGMLFGDMTGMEASVRRYARKIAGEQGWAERFWQPLSSRIGRVEFKEQETSLYSTLKVSGNGERTHLSLGSHRPSPSRFWRERPVINLVHPRLRQNSCGCQGSPQAAQS
jgi:LmbE family N-acetylglucosaminyl deacetylase